MNARQLFISTLSIGTLAIAGALNASPSQATPAYSTPTVNVATGSYGVAVPATVSFRNNSLCNIQVRLTDTQEVRYVAPGQTVRFSGLSTGATPVFLVHNRSNGVLLRTLNLQPISSAAVVSFRL